MSKKTIICHLSAFLFLLLGLPSSIYGQRQAKIDSLQGLLSSVQARKKVDVLDDIAWEFTFLNPDSTFVYANQQLATAKRLQYDRGAARAYGNLARANAIKGNFDTALELYEKGMHLRGIIGDRKGVATFLNNMAIIYRNRGDYITSLDNYLLALSVYTELKDERGQANAYNNMGVVYKELDDYQEALSNYRKALELTTKIGFLRGQGNALNNIGNVHSLQRHYDSALYIFQESLLVQKKRKNAHGMGDVFLNISKVHADQQQFEAAFAYADSAYHVYHNASNQKGVAETYNNQARYYLKKYNFPQAIQFANTSLKMAKEMKTASIEQESSEVLANAYQHIGNYEQAFYHISRSNLLKDSLQNKDLRKQLSQMRHRYDLDVERLKISALEQENKLNRIIQYAALAIVIILIGITYLFFNRYQIKNKANQLLEIKNTEILQQKEKIESQRDNIENQHQQISHQLEELEAQSTLLTATNIKIEKAYSHIQESIQYAKRIQEAVVGKQEDIIQQFKDAFILYLPKNVVSGDFYWFHHQEDSGIKYLICADCTGHGVPGAMMTAIGNTLLNEIIKVGKTKSPAQILYLLDQQIQKTLRQSNEKAQQDGMDMTILKFNEQAQTLTCAGAKNPIVFIRNQEVKVIKGAKFSVGGQAVRKEKVFEEHQFNLQKDDIIYLYSDGFQDQFGGKKDRKYLSKRFRQLLANNSHLNMSVQRNAFMQELRNWQGDYEQTDDILVIGLKF